MPDEKTLLTYQAEDGSSPFDEWLNGLRDVRAKARIRVRLNRLRIGLLGDAKPVGDAVHELRISEGKGYRVYFANVENTIVLLLCGGDKSTQSRDIKQAKGFYDDFKSRTKN